MADRRSRGEDRYSRRDGRRGRSESDSPKRKRRKERSRSPRERPSSRRDDRNYERERKREDETRREGRHSSRRNDQGRNDDRGSGRGMTHRETGQQDSASSHDREWDRGKEGGPPKIDGQSPSRPRHSEKKSDDSQSSAATKKAEPDFGLSGKLAAETNTLNGVLIKYSEPPEARIPKTRWRFYQFKGDDLQNTLFLHRQSAYLIGRDRKVIDFPIDHPSCSKQHAVLQYRLVDYVKQDGRKGKKVKPYIIDLESTNGTYINNQRIDSRRFFELKEKDMVKFGFSSREYVLLHENSKGSDDEDDEGDINQEMAL